MSISIQSTNLKFSDNLNDIEKKKNLFTHSFLLNPKGVNLITQQENYPFSYSHKNVKLLVAPFSDYDVNIWFLKFGDFNILIDTGPSYQILQAGITHYEVAPSHVLITHNHLDHVGGLKGLRSAFPNILTALPEGIEGITTPGHCQDHLSYYIPDLGICFCGDALFAGSIGKPNYSPSDSIKSLHTLLSLPEDTILFPGHGAPTSVKWEREYNCFYTI